MAQAVKAPGHSVAVSVIQGVPKVPVSMPHP